MRGHRDLEKLMSESSSRGWTILGVLLAAGALVVGILTFLEPDYPNRLSSDSDRAPYIATVDEICSAALVQLRNLGRPPLEDPASYGEYTLAANQIANNLLHQWAQVVPPKEDFETVRAMLDIQEEIVFRSNEMGRLLSAGDTQTASPIIDQIQDDQLALRQQTRVYGFKVCSRLMGD